ncbi:hypothetical protein LB565_08580 [Mesorhizobium sp. CA14]|uniref:hypothetical protein n=1 Tax=Mesorhizobium sp. CA14 TaxID=2876642 RepID=UPI001CCAC04D|nr:hypothetical protein [Mesorhizobium sp. CA14]MBZ9848040.1 hypothetical protein [Mesorhizobium sp. CA14]
MKLDDEVHHSSEDISDLVLSDVVSALHRRLKVSHEFDIPYIAGYSRNAMTIYIDRHLPRTIRWRGKDVRLEPFLVCHEIVEKTLLDNLRLHYLHAHQIASRIERDAVKAAGLTWRHYQGVNKGHEKAIDEEQLRGVPGELDLTPYKDLKDYPLLRRLVQASQ